jgi:hypothetical protein
MKLALIGLFSLLLIACGGRERAADTADARAIPSEAKAKAPISSITDEQIGMPAYPNATEVEYSRVKLRMDVGETFSVAYKSTDTPVQVAEFYRAEAPKVGTLKRSMSPSDLLQTVSIDRTDGSQSTIKAMSDGKGATVITIHRFFPAAK